MNTTRSLLLKHDLPSGDQFDLSSSVKRFDDGAQYRYEVPGIQGPSTMNALLDELENLSIKIHRVTQTKGIMSLTDGEIDEMLLLAKQNNIDLVLSVGPRATNDTSATAQTAEGKRIGLRLRGQEQIVRAIEDVRRATQLGCRSILVYDEGLLWLLNKLRASSDLPHDCKFKVSAHCGHGNPCSFKLLESIGADSINPVRDLQLPMLSAIRSAIDVPIDLHTENPASSGGFIRHYEVPEMIRVTAPIYLKTGGSVAQTHSWDTNVEQAKQRAKQVALVKRMIDAYYPESICS